MSTVETAVLTAGTTGAGLPRERRLLVALLAALEGALLIAAAVVAYLYRPVPVPVSVPANIGSSGYLCIAPGGAGGAPYPTPVPYPCPPADNSYMIALLIAAACGAAALLVLPVVIGLVSRRWQSALAAPAIPLWVALLVLVGISLAGDGSAYTSGVGGGVLSSVSAWEFAISLAGPALSALLLTVAFGGLGWLARRAFAR
jgi:hypothetical protein